MDAGYITIIVLLAVGVAYGMRKRPQAPPTTSDDAWKGLGVIVALIAGLVVANATGSEGLTWVFGLSLMIAVPLMFFFAIGSAIGSRFRRGEDE
jgi:hypothetical protein